MDERYQHRLTARLWSRHDSYRRWLRIGRVVAQEQGYLGVIPLVAARQISGFPLSRLGHQQCEVIDHLERQTQHDVAAFLSWWRNALGDLNRTGAARYVHFGLTSSDLVDTAMGMRFADIAVSMERDTLGVQRRLEAMSQTGPVIPLLGRTHGQPAEPTSLQVRAAQWFGMFYRARTALSQAHEEMQYAKLSGPVGTFAHNPPQVEERVAQTLGLTPARWGSSQVIPRDRLAVWASAAAQLVRVCAKIGVDFRLMASRGEVTEGWPAERVGSSAMPHKKNPVNAEKLAGMARLATGYAHMLEPVDLWEDRDISHSSVERVAVPDLLHVLFHTLHTLQSLIEQAQWDTAEMEAGCTDHDWAGYSAKTTLDLVRLGYTRQEAERTAAHEPEIGQCNPRWFTRHYPGLTEK